MEAFFGVAIDHEPVSASFSLSWSGMAAQPRYGADRPVAGVTVRDAQFFLIGHFISPKFSVQQKNTYNRLFNMTSSYLFRLRTDIISRLDQDSQLSLLPATSVARGKKLATFDQS